MLPYWLLFSIASACALLFRPEERSGARTLAAIAGGIALAIFIGLRFRVGGDWDTYELIFIDVAQASFDEAMLIIDPAYAFLNWMVGTFGGEVWHVNLICAILFAYGLIRFCATLPVPWLGAVAAVPTLVIVLAMGFTRQASAIACIMLAASAYKGGFSPRWIFWLAVAVTFHRSAIFMVPIFFLASSRYKALNIGIGIAIGLFLLTTFVLGSLEGLLTTYVGGELESSGAAIRLSMAVAAALFYFLFINDERRLGDQYRLWRNMGLAVLALVPAYFLTSAVVVDRLAFLLLPFQLLVYSAVPIVLARTPGARLPLTLGVVVLTGAVLGGWLFLADHSQFWLPYRNVLTEPYLY